MGEKCVLITYEERQEAVERYILKLECRDGLITKIKAFKLIGPLKLVSLED